MQLEKIPPNRTNETEGLIVRMTSSRLREGEAKKEPVTTVKTKLKPGLY